MKVIPLGRAVERAARISAELGLSPDENVLFSHLATSCSVYDSPAGQAISLQEYSNFLRNFAEAIKNRDVSFLFQPRGLCVDRMVDVVEFAESKGYMGQKGRIRPVVMDGLIEAFASPRSDNYLEIVLCGSSGWGKTYYSYIALGYMLYKLLCYHCPQVEFGLAPGTSIVLIQQNKTYNLARKVVFDQFAEIIRDSPFFSQKFPFDRRVKSELRFPKNILLLPMGGSDTSALGFNVFAAVIEEMNFMSVVKDSVMAMPGIDNEEYDQAERVYRVLSRRIKTRFIQLQGRTPGKLLLISQANYPGDFTSRKEEEAKRDKDHSILVLRHTQWEAMPEDRWSGEKFCVEVGSEKRRPRILTRREDAIDPDGVIEVPVELRKDFERDLTSALKDFGGYVTGVEHPFFPDPERIIKAQQEYARIQGGKSLFLYQDVIIDELVDPVAPNWFRLVNEKYLHECILNRGDVFSCHIDVAVSEDAVGIAVGRIYGYKLIQSARVYNPRTSSVMEVRDIRLPVYMIDGVLRLIPGPRKEIDLEMARDLICWLRGEINIKWATMDSYQAALLIMAFRKTGIRSGVLSVDENIAPYTEVKIAVKDERIFFPPHATLAREFRQLEKMRDKDKVNHPPSGSKDCSDAVAGVVHMLQTKEANFMSRASRRDRRAGVAQAAGQMEPVRHVRLGRYRRWMRH